MKTIAAGAEQRHVMSRTLFISIIQALTMVVESDDREDDANHDIARIAHPRAPHEHIPPAAALSAAASSLVKAIRKSSGRCLSRGEAVMTPISTTAISSSSSSSSSAAAAATAGCTCHAIRSAVDAAYARLQLPGCNAHGPPNRPSLTHGWSR